MGVISSVTTTHVTRSRGSVGAADRPTVASAGSTPGDHHRRPLSLAEPSSSSMAVNSGVFRTLPSSKRSKRKVSWIILYANYPNGIIAGIAARLGSTIVCNSQMDLIRNILCTQ